MYLYYCRLIFLKMYTSMLKTSKKHSIRIYTHARRTHNFNQIYKHHICISQKIEQQKL